MSAKTAPKSSRSIADIINQLSNFPSTTPHQTNENYNKQHDLVDAPLPNPKLLVKYVSEMNAVIKVKWGWEW